MDPQTIDSRRMRRPRRLVPRATTGAIAAAAVIFALGSTGGAIAGTLITGKQIKDGTVTGADIKNKSITGKDLARSARPPRGTAGPAGAPGERGPAGSQGPAGAHGPGGDRGPMGMQGPTGERGPAGPVSGALPSGSTMKGAWVITEPTGTPAGQTSTTAVSLGLYSTNRVPAHVVPAGGVKPAACTGTIWSPTAAAGHFCLYVGFSNGYDPSAVYVVGQASAGSPDDVQGTVGELGPVGGTISVPTAGNGAHYVRGVWAYTAP